MGCKPCGRHSKVGRRQSGSDLGPVDVVLQAGEQADVVGKKVLSVVEGDDQRPSSEVGVFLKNPVSHRTALIVGKRLGNSRNGPREPGRPNPLPGHDQR